MKKEYLIKTKLGNFWVKIWFNRSDKVYLVKGVTLPDVVTLGQTLEKAKNMAKEAIEIYCESLIDQGHIIIDADRRAFGPVPKSHIIQFA